MLSQDSLEIIAARKRRAIKRQLREHGIAVSLSMPEIMYDLAALCKVRKDFLLLNNEVKT